MPLDARPSESTGPKTDSQTKFELNWDDIMTLFLRYVEHGNAQDLVDLARSIPYTAASARDLADGLRTRLRKKKLSIQFLVNRANALPHLRLAGLWYRIPNKLNEDLLMSGINQYCPYETNSSRRLWRWVVQLGLIILTQSLFILLEGGDQ